MVMAAPVPITLGYAREQLAEWMAALEAANLGQSYSIGGRNVSRQDIPNIRAEIQRWHNSVTALEADAAGHSRPLGAQAAFEAPGRGAGGIIPQDLWNRW